MKKNLTFFAFATMMVLGMSSVFYACSSDDDDNGNQQKAGDEAVAELKSILLDSDGNVVFGEANEQGFYQIGLESQSDAQSLVAKYVNNAVFKDGKADYQLPDNRGKVSATQDSEEGVFYQVQFVVKGIPSMNLQVVEENYMDKDNAYNTFIKYQCKKSNCRIKFKLHNLAEKVCPKCGSTELEQQ